MEQFFRSQQELASFVPQFPCPEPDDPREFLDDIREGLEAWGREGGVVCYRTARYVYVCERIIGRGRIVITMARFDRKTMDRTDACVDLRKFTAGLDYLLGEQEGKRVDIFGSQPVLSLIG
jgi:hypothetical protein